MKPRTVPLPLMCIASADSREIFSLPLLANDRPLYAVDLTEGIAGGLHAARELAMQLSITLPANLIGANAIEGDPVGLVSAWVDAEGRGNAVMRQAATIAETLVIALQNKASPVLLIMLGDAARTSVPPEELAFLWLLFSGLSGSAVDVVLQTDRPENIAALLPWAKLQWLLTGNIVAPAIAVPSELLPWVPGLVAPELLAAQVDLGQGGSTQCLALDNGYYLIAPECRPARDAVPPDFAPAVRRVLLSFPLVYAHLVTRGLTPITEDLAILVRAAWALAGQGGATAAQRVMTALVSHACTHRIPAYGALLRDLQSLRIAAQDYIAAATEEADRALLDDDGWRDYLLTQAWGRVLSGDPQGALRVFQDAGAPALAKSRNVIDLYLCNIYALALHRTGHVDEALDLEQGIRRRLDVLPEPSHHLNYINHFNLSRLHRAAGRLTEERAHIEQVFTTTDGLRSESDRIYLNLTLASLQEREGRPLDALVSTWRACVHWLCCEVPEAIGWRTLLSLFARRVQLEPQGLGKISEALHQRLQLHLDKCGISRPEVKGQPPVFVNIRSARGVIDPAGCVAHLGDPYGVLVASPTRHHSVLDSSAHQPLAQLVSGVYQRAVGPAHVEAPSWLVDDDYGVEIPAGETGLVEVMLRWGVPTNRAPDTSTDEARLLDSVLLSGHGVAKVDCVEKKVRVHFKRYLPTLEVSPKLQPVITEIARVGGISLREALTLCPDTELATVVAARNLLRRLEMSRAVRLAVR